MRRVSAVLSVVVLVLVVAGCDDGADPTTFPQYLPQRPAYDTPLIQTAEYGRPHQPDDATTAAFRTACRPSHASYDDPIVYPGIEDGSPHLHVFYGNVTADAYSYEPDAMLTGASTCDGGSVNRTAYWAPAMLDTSDGVPSPVVSNYLTPCPLAQQFTQCALDRGNSLQVYYKDGYVGIQPLASDYPYTVSPAGWTAVDVQNFPPGLRMIAGDATASSPQGDAIEWRCAVGPAFDQGVTQQGSTMPTCAPGLIVAMIVEFPQCWDGTNLDSPDHRSHVVAALGWPDQGCPPAHPVPLPQITQLFRWRVPSSGMGGWRLSSDMMNPNVAAGTTAHADWFNGWDESVFQEVIDNCYGAPPGWRDCSMNLLGPFAAANSTPDGDRLYDAGP